VSVVWGALAGGVSTWLGTQARSTDPADPPPTPEDDDDE
jgi:hypothetical protein